MYAEISKYNYGPIWALLLGAFAKMSALFSASSYESLFRSLIIGLLSMADLGIFILLYRRYSLLVSALFWLNPISIIITGYHNQFDNLALCVGLYAGFLLDDESAPLQLSKRKIFGIILLGCSLMIKHIFFLFPLWLALKQKTRLAQILALTLPVCIFFAAFLPYWSVGKEGIMNNVFYYQSTQNGVFYELFAPKIIALFFSSKQLWILFLLFFGFFYKRTSVLDSLFFYTAIFVMASPSLAGQYFVIVVPYISRCYKNVCFAMYTIVVSVFFVLHPGELHYSPDFLSPLLRVPVWIYWALIVNFLTLGIAWELFGPAIRKRMGLMSNIEGGIVDTGRVKVS